MENVNIAGVEYRIIKTLESDNKLYYYTLDIANDNEVVILCQNKLVENSKPEKVDDEDYGILMNKFAIK